MKDKNLMNDILVVDDETDIRMLIKGILNDEGLSVREAANADQTLKAVATRRPNLIILDIWLNNSTMDGMQILQHMRKEYPDVPVIMISGHGTIDTAVAAIKLGAYDFIEKPFKADRLILQVRHALDAARLKRENQELKSRAGGEDGLIGKSAPIVQLRQIVEKVAQTGSRILISGHSGSGKELFARTVHKSSRRADGAFVVINCGTLSAQQLETELFGAEPNAQGGTRQVGVLETAHGGTLYLDEIGDMPPEVQGKLVRFLQEHSFTRMGGSTKVEVDVRVIASTSGDPQYEVAEGKIRQDLFYRLNVVPVVIPALAERQDDIPMLAEYFLARASEMAGSVSRTLGEDAMAALQAYGWPGNVRQLRNAMEWVVMMASGDAGEPIRADQLPPEITSSAPLVLRWEKSGEIMGLPLRDAREVFEREYLIAQVTRFGGNISRTAGFIGMERSALHRKLKLLGVHGSTNENQTALPEQTA